MGQYMLEMASRSVTIGGEDARLAPREFDLAWILFSQPSRLLTKDELLALLWGRQADFGAHTIAQHVHTLRKKLAFDAHGFALQSVYAAGYRLEPLSAAPLRSDSLGYGLGSPSMMDARHLGARAGARAAGLGAETVSPPHCSAARKRSWTSSVSPTIASSDCSPWLFFSMCAPVSS